VALLVSFADREHSDGGDDAGEGGGDGGGTGGGGGGGGILQVRQWQYLGDSHVLRPQWGQRQHQLVVAVEIDEGAGSQQKIGFSLQPVVLLVATQA
jgi:hypothetical protein